MNYYNEFDPQAAQWLRNLIAAGLIPAGDVDERSIEDVTPNELRGYTQCHFFAGIAGWSLALDLAGWPRDRPVWTGSCPCQPFSSAGKGDGFADQRHLWPAWFHLIRQCKPDIVFGEQVASAIRHGWLDLVSADLEAEGYAVGASVLGAHSVGAPHIRQRLYWMADAGSQWRIAGRDADEIGRRANHAEQTRMGGGSVMADTNLIASRQGRQVNGGRDSRGDAESRAGLGGGGVFGMGDASNPRSQGHGRPVEIIDAQGRQDSGRHGAAAGFWAGEWRTGADGKARLVKPGLELLAHGVPARVVKLRAFGNAICPQTAAAFIAAYMAGESVVELAA